MKVPAVKEQKGMNVSSAPPEYDFLEEADIYLRFGHDKLAEEVLREAIKINPSNPHTYLTLLGIYESRGDAKGFAAVATEMKEVGDNADWQKAVEMGKRIDPANPLYD
jgi:pilus assembly protein FimV